MNAATLEIDTTMPWASWTAPTTVQTNLVKLAVRQHGETEQMEVMAGDTSLGVLGRDSMKELAGKISFPTDFVEKLSPQLQASVIQERLEHAQPADLTFVTEEGRLVSMFPDWRGVCSHAMIAQVSYNLLRDVYSDVEVRHARILPGGTMDTRFLLPIEQPVTRQVGDTLRMGVDVRHRYGTDISAQLFIERLVCLNGATTAEYQFAWTQRTLGAVNHQLMWLKAGIQGASAAYENFVERARLMAATTVEGDLSQQLVVRARSMRMPRRYERELIEAFNAEAGNTEWHMHNAFTRFATHHPELDDAMRARLQRAAGDWTREFDMVTARLPRPIATSVGAEIIYEDHDE